MGKDPANCLQWLRIRIAVGLSVSDQGFAEFVQRQEEEEVSHWRAILDLSSAPEPVLPFVVYYTMDGDDLPDGQGPRLHSRHGSRQHWDAVGASPKALRSMLFYPRSLTGEAAPDPTPAEGTAEAAALTELYAHCSFASERPSKLMPGAEAVPTLEVPPEGAALEDLTRIVGGWSVVVGKTLAIESRRPVPPTALGEVEYWAERLAVVEGLQQQLDAEAAARALDAVDAAGTLPCPRWPAHRAQLLAALLEARRRASDASLLCKPLNAIRNTLPRRLGGIQPLWSALAPFYCTVSMLSVAARQELEVVDLERILAKAGAELSQKVVEHVRYPSLFEAPAEQLTPLADYDTSAAPGPGAVRTRAAEVLPCVTSGRQRCLESLELLREWTAVHHRAARSVAATPHARPWRCESRRVFERVAYCTGVCQDLVSILDDLSAEMPSMEEDLAGYDRMRRLIVLPLGVTFDAFDPAQGGNWRAFRRRWEEAVRNKEAPPKSLTEYPLRLKDPVQVDPIELRLPMATVVRDHTTGPHPDSLLATLEPCGSDADKLLELQQEKAVLISQLVEAKRLAAEDRSTIESLRAECSRAWALVKSMKDRPRCEGDRVG